MMGTSSNIDDIQLPYTVVLTNVLSSPLIAALGRPYCAIYLFLVYFAPSMSVWIVVAITLIRFIAVVFPLKAVQLTTFRAAKIYTTVIISLFVGYGVPGLVYGKDPDVRPAPRCVWNLSLQRRSEYVLVYTVHVMLAFFFLIVFNISIFYHMNKRKAQMTVMKSTSQAKEDRAVMVMVMSVTVTFMILQFPWIIHITVWDSIQNKGGLTLFHQTLRQFTYYMTLLCFAVNCSINFVLYVICCRKFREDFKHLLLCRFSHLGKA
jgi:hypothetical protein